MKTVWTPFLIEPSLQIQLSHGTIAKANRKSWTAQATTTVTDKRTCIKINKLINLIWDQKWPIIN